MGYFGHASYKLGEILSSDNIMLVFSSPRLVGTPNFMLVACLAGPEVMAMLPPQPTKPITMPRQPGFSGGGKNKLTKPRIEGRDVSYGKIGLTTVAVTRDLLSVMPLVL